MFILIVFESTRVGMKSRRRRAPEAPPTCSNFTNLLGHARVANHRYSVRIGLGGASAESAEALRDAAAGARNAACAVR